ncbi:MAG: Tryptophan synthase alpha chain [Labilithrix sp.]|nr:Tryptophan synthase alpha chain [Labilithrix sp.]
MKPLALSLVTVPLLAFFLACSSESAGTGGDAGTDGSAGINDGSDGSSEPDVCTEFHVGGTNDPGIAGSAPGQVAAQAAADIAAAAAKQISGITQSCKTIAIALDAPSSQRSTAEAQTEATTKATAWCDVAAAAVLAAKTVLTANVRLTFTPPKCRLSVDLKGACQERCAGAPCDVATNPMTCVGGELSSGFCEGDKLEGGCTVDPKCNANCDVSVIAAAECPTPDLTAEVISPDEVKAAAFSSLIETELPAVLALRAQFEAEASLFGTFAGNLPAITDIKPACIPLLTTAAANAMAEVRAGFEASNDVVTTLH